MSSTSSQIISQSRLLALPTEVQDKVVKNLKFADVHRLSSTCTHFRHTIHKGLHGESLLEIERDWIDVARGVPHDKWSQRPNADDMRLGLIAKGYTLRDIRRIYIYAPCYTCLSLVQYHKFHRRNGGQRVPPLWSLIDRGLALSVWPTQPEKLRRCIDCDMAAGFPNKEWPWLESARCLIGYCRGCDSITETGLDVDNLQVESQLCDSCFTSAKRRDGWEDKQAALESHIQQLQKYADWMASGDRSPSRDTFNGFKHEPYQPDGMQHLDWSWPNLRPDAPEGED